MRRAKAEIAGWRIEPALPARFWLLIFPVSFPAFKLGTQFVRQFGFEGSIQLEPGHTLLDGIEKRHALPPIFSALQWIALVLHRQPQFLQGKPSRVRHDETRRTGIAADDNVRDEAAL